MSGPGPTGRQARAAAGDLPTTSHVQPATASDSHGRHQCLKPGLRDGLAPDASAGLGRGAPPRLVIIRSESAAGLGVTVTVQLAVTGLADSY